MGRRCLLPPINNLGSSEFSWLLAASIIFAVSLPTASLDQRPSCFPSDYARTAGPCEGSYRTVQYKPMRDCKPEFNVTGDFSEGCDCTPNDFVSDYSLDTTTNTCSLTYQLAPAGCDGTPSAPIPVDNIYCVVESTPCTVDNIVSTYTQCDKTTDNIGLIYYFNDTCNPLAAGSVHLPPVSYIDCNTHCGPGTFLSGTTCQTCPNGTFSIGGGIRLEGFTNSSLDDSTFKISCSYVGPNGTTQCEKNSWRVESSSLKVGPFDQPNEKFQDECEDGSCHNGLTAALVMNVKLVRDGYVLFNFSVDAEKSFDGISFLVDDVVVMPLKTFTISVEQKTVNLTVGYHKLSWVFTKDEKWTQGKDSATITLIEVDGTDFNDHGCIDCLPGYYSDEGASRCIPCPADNYTDKPGEAQCSACPSDSYALNVPRTNCTKQPICDVGKDATISYGPCLTASQQRLQTYAWLQPQICKPRYSKQLPAPKNISCGDCPVGQVPFDNTTDGTRICQLCPAGSARGVEDTECHACGSGKAAVRTLNLAHFSMLGGNLPDGFTTGCSGDCGLFSWRTVNDYVDSGSGHGNSVSVWLALNVTMEMDGYIRFNFSVDIPDGDKGRAFFFYVDDELEYDVQDDEYDGGMHSQWTNMISLRMGTHQLMWVWVKLNADPQVATRDSAIIYDIWIRGESRGGAAACENVEEGSFLLPGGTAWMACPPGTYSLGNTSTCLPCPANTFNLHPGAGINKCLPCNPGTSSLPNSTDCFVGDVSVPSSFCTYSPPAASEVQDADYTLYNLSPLSRLHPQYMFGPVYENASDPLREDGELYYASICERSTNDANCISVTGEPLNTFLCKVRARTPYDDSTKRRSATDLGLAVSFSPLSSDPGLIRRGFIMQFTGESCPFNPTQGSPRMTNITFVCDPGSGYGQPEAWTSEALRTVLDPSSPFPWVNRNGTLESVQSSDPCSFSMVWYSAYACPMCSPSDYETVDLQGCVNDKMTTHRLKVPIACQVNPLTPLLPDTPCSPCTVSDMIVDEHDCVDSNGDANITYRWKEPLLCNPNANISAKLPESYTAGMCYQNITMVDPTLTSVEFAMAGVVIILIIVLSVVSVLTYLKSQKIYSAYTKLKESERPEFLPVEEGGIDSPGPDYGYNTRIFSRNRQESRFAKTP